MNIFKTGKSLAENTTGFKSTAITFSYQLAFWVICINLVLFYVLMFMGGVMSDFTVYADVLKDFALPIITATITFCSIAITTCLGAQAIDGRKDDTNSPQQ